MKLTKELIFTLLVASFSTANLFGQITVTNTETPEELIEDVLLGAGIVASNIEFNHSTADAGVVQVQAGYFDGAGTTFPLAAGVVLTTGNVALAVGPNDDTGATDDTGVSADLGFGGMFNDVDLDDIASDEVFHETIIAFDFVPTGDSIAFNYVFASEEYLEFVDAGFNDIFGFFISGPGFAGPYEFGAENIAVIPGTTIPVAIDNVNNVDFPALYVDNPEGAPDVQFDGYTVSLTAGANVICGETYHIKMAIGDVGDESLDSGVFLEAGSFTSNEIEIEIASAIGADAIIEGCDSALVSFIRPTGLDEELTLDYEVGGTATNGVDYAPLDGDVFFPIGEDTITFWIFPVNDGIVEGTETIIISVELVNDCGDTVSSEATIEILDAEPLVIATTDTLINCAVDSLLIDFEIVSGGVPDFDILWSSGDTDFDAWVPGNILGTTTYTIAVTDACGATATDEIDVTLAPLSSPTILFDATDYTICAGDDQLIDVTIEDAIGVLDYAWMPGGETTEDITVAPIIDTWFVLSVDNGCVVVMDSVFVTAVVVELDVTMLGET